MKLELSLKLKQPEFPLDYRRSIISFFKNALTMSADGRYFDTYFGPGKRKDYTFTVLFNRPQFTKERINLENNQIRILFSCDDRRKTGMIFLAAFIAQKHRAFKLPAGNEMILQKIDQRREKDISGSKLICKTSTGSGLCCRQHNRKTNRDQYFTFSDPEFELRMQEVMRIQATEAGFPENMAKSIHIRPIQWKKVVVKHYAALIDTSVGLFELEADRDLIQYFYRAGCGSRTSSGFGNIDVVMNM